MTVLGVPHGDPAGCPFPLPLTPALTGFSCSRRLMAWGAGCWQRGAGCWVVSEGVRQPWEGGGGGGMEEGAGCVQAVGDGGGEAPMALANPGCCLCPAGPSSHAPSSSLAWWWGWGWGHQAGEWSMPELPGNLQAQHAGEDRAHGAGCRQALTQCPSLTQLSLPSLSPVPSRPAPPEPTAHRAVQGDWERCHLQDRTPAWWH